mmetsp:Transcript_27766/g.92286  ORF Transcript_27766/g.92286 Transcript_27766/m.92286 type:complete len:294 (+) Transcript_27766:489-1370(+)
MCHAATSSERIGCAAGGCSKYDAVTLQHGHLLAVHADVKLCEVARTTSVDQHLVQALHLQRLKIGRITTGIRFPASHHHLQAHAADQRHRRALGAEEFCQSAHPAIQRKRCQESEGTSGEGEHWGHRASEARDCPSQRPITTYRDHQVDVLRQIVARRKGPRAREHTLEHRLVREQLRFHDRRDSLGREPRGHVLQSGHNHCVPRLRDQQHSARAFLPLHHEALCTVRLHGEALVHHHGRISGAACEGTRRADIRIPGWRHGRLKPHFTFDLKRQRLPRCVLVFGLCGLRARL